MKQDLQNCAYEQDLTKGHMIMFFLTYVKSEVFQSFLKAKHHTHKCWLIC